MHNQLKPCHCFLTAHKYHKKYVRCFLKNQQLCETHTYHGKHPYLLQAVEGDAEGLQLHPVVVWVCSSCRSDPVLLALGTVTSGEVPGVGACWKGALEGPGALPASVLSVLTGLILPAEEWFLVGCLCRL